MLSTRFAALVTASVLALPVAAQRVSTGPEPDRKVSTVVIQDENDLTVAGVSISYAPAKWHDEYEAMFDVLKGTYQRIGKGWWTTFDTLSAIEIGGTKIAAGSYYLGLDTDKDGAFSLVLFDSKATMQRGLLPGSTPLYRHEHEPAARVPMKLARGTLATAVAQLELVIAVDEKSPRTGTVAIRWGKHELTAPVKFRPAESAPAAGEKK